MSLKKRALSALGFAQRCSDDEFIKFLGDKKLSKTNKAHNLGQHLLLLLEGKIYFSLINVVIFIFKMQQRAQNHLTHSHWQPHAPSTRPVPIEG